MIYKNKQMQIVNRVSPRGVLILTNIPRHIRAQEFLDKLDRDIKERIEKRLIKS